MCRPRPREAKALILAPTRELAVQIEQSLRTYGRFLNLRIAVILGGVSQNAPGRAMKHGVDILVATPGRLLDLVQQKHVRLDAVSTFIVDEADRMLDMGFIRDVRKIVALSAKAAPVHAVLRHHARRHRKLVGDDAAIPERIEVAPQGKTADRITQKLYHRAHGAEAPAAERAAEGRGDEPGDRLHPHQARRQQRGRASVAAPGQWRTPSTATSRRMPASARWKCSAPARPRVLVATDIAARGIDIDDISHVVNFELPNEPESYVHRIGRTARAGGEGIAISFCDASERGYLRDIERVIRMKIKVVAHDLPELTEEQRRQMETPRQPHGHRHGKPHGHKAGGHKHGGQNQHGGQRAEEGHNPHAPKKRNGSRPHWSKERRAHSA